MILPPGLVIDGVDDSKKLSEKKREALYDIIAAEALAWAAAFVGPEVIDEINIRQATHRAMEMAVAALAVRPTFCWWTGMTRFPFPYRANIL